MRARSTGPPIQVMRARLMSCAPPARSSSDVEFGEQFGLDALARRRAGPGTRRVDAGEAGAHAQARRRAPATGRTATARRRRAQARARSTAAASAASGGIELDRATRSSASSAAARDRAGGLAPRAARAVVLPAATSAAGSACQAASISSRSSALLALRARPVSSAARRSASALVDGTARPRRRPGACAPAPPRGRARRCCAPAPAAASRARRDSVIPARAPRGAAVPRSVPARCFRARSWFDPQGQAHVARDVRRRRRGRARPARSATSGASPSTAAASSAGGTRVRRACRRQQDQVGVGSERARGTAVGASSRRRSDARCRRPRAGSRPPSPRRRCSRTRATVSPGGSGSGSRRSGRRSRCPRRGRP